MRFFLIAVSLMFLTSPLAFGGTQITLPFTFSFYAQGLSPGNSLDSPQSIKRDVAVSIAAGLGLRILNRNGDVKLDPNRPKLVDQLFRARSIYDPRYDDKAYIQDEIDLHVNLGFLDQFAVVGLKLLDRDHVEQHTKGATSIRPALQALVGKSIVFDHHAGIYAVINSWQSIQSARDVEWMVGLGVPVLLQHEGAANVVLGFGDNFWIIDSTRNGQRFIPKPSSPDAYVIDRFSVVEAGSLSVLQEPKIQQAIKQIAQNRYQALTKANKHNRQRPRPKFDVHPGNIKNYRFAESYDRFNVTVKPRNGDGVHLILKPARKITWWKAIRVFGGGEHLGQVEAENGQMNRASLLLKGLNPDTIYELEFYKAKAFGAKKRIKRHSVDLYAFGSSEIVINWVED